ncbi:MAG TPA: hypothetical protein VN797_02610, partial [Gemmatimonadaceae bacterium]|nr:hypothetical protein [Gemmatimonadaceae bacterium]
LGDYGEGWLCFESQQERRRLARFPDDWDRMSEADLCSLLSKAALVPVRNRQTPPKSGDSINR